MALALALGCAGPASVEGDGDSSEELGPFEVDPLGGPGTRSLATLAVGTGPNRVEMTFANRGTGVAGCGEAGILCVDVTVTSHYTNQELRGLTVSLDAVTPASAVAANGSVRPAYLPAKVRDDLGLWVYGDLAPGESVTRQWRHHWSGGSVAVKGKLFADVVPVDALRESSCANGSDDDGDRKLDCGDADCTGDPACCGGDDSVCDDPGPRVTQVVAGAGHTCAVVSTGAVRCWGQGGYGQLGYPHPLLDDEMIGNNETPAAPGDVDVGGPVIQVAAGHWHTCALLDGGTVRCWGHNSRGQLGYGHTQSIFESPAEAGDVDVGGIVTQIVTGGDHTCALLDTGAVRCWGMASMLGYGDVNSVGNIGDDEAPASAGDVPVGGTVTQLAAGRDHTCALLDTGAVRCWGRNVSGQLGYGHTTWLGDTETPASSGDVDVGGAVAQIEAGPDHTCAVLTTGVVRCWGQAQEGALGYGNTTSIGDNETPASAGNVDVGGAVTQIAVGYGHTCARLTTGAVRCWGNNYGGQLGYGNTTDIGDDEVAASAGDVDVGGAVTQITAGGAHTCALLTTGGVRCWGSSDQGVLGYASTDSIGDDETPASAGDLEILGDPSAESYCADGQDDDVDGDIDCADLDCAEDVACLPTTEVSCTNGVDDDGDTDIDCSDPDCAGDVACLPTTEVSCTNGEDDDGDSDIDCSDVDCFQDAACLPITETSCTNGVDDDADSDVDCEDPDCSGDPACDPAVEANCSNQVDDDGDVAVDCDDPDCTGQMVCLEPQVTQLVGGLNHTCALLSTGSVRCWGASDFGQGGHGNTSNVGDDEEPSSAGDVDVGGTAIQLAAGNRHTCALMSTGAVRCWGRNESGQLGYGHTMTIGDGETPASAGIVNVGGIVTQLTAGVSHTCALLESGTVRCWGLGEFGQLGYGNTATIGDDESPASAGNVNVGGTVTQLSAGAFHTCALLDTGAVRCWGRGLNGRLGYGDQTSIGDDEAPSVAGDVQLGGTAVQVDAGNNHTCALLDTGTVRCWGNGSSGPLGYGNQAAIGDDELPSSAGDVDVGGVVTQIVADSFHTCALLEAGAVRCWGSGDFGKLGYGNTTAIGDNETPASAGNILLGGPVSEIALGTDHNCALLASGAVRCWGRGGSGRLGYGNTANIGDNETPASAGDVQILGEPTEEIYCGNGQDDDADGDTDCADPDCEEYMACWPSNEVSCSDGEDDDGDIDIDCDDLDCVDDVACIPVTELSCTNGVDDDRDGDLDCVDGDCAGGVACDPPVTQLAAGSLHTCALLDTGAVRCWGLNEDGRLGYGHTNDIGDDETPSSAGDVDVGGTVTQIVAGGAHTCALLDTGAVRCWGLGNHGRLGYGNSSSIGDDESPASAGNVDVGGTVTQLAAGFDHTCALLDTGAVRCWGYGEPGALGYANTAWIGDDETPASAGDVDVGGSVTQISASGRVTCALMATGAVRCWGRNDYGQLGYGHVMVVGDDETPSSAGDVDVGGTVTQVAAGSVHTCALLDTGAVRCWGRAEYGVLGYGGSSDLHEPAGDVNVGDTVTRIAVGSSHTCAVLVTGAVRCWGYGPAGALGYGNSSNVGLGPFPNPDSAGDVAVGGTVRQVVTGHLRTCALMDTGAVRCWGLVMYGALGLGDGVFANIGDNETPASVGVVSVY